MVSLIIFFLSKVAGEFLRCEQVQYGEVNIEDCKLEARQKGYDKPIFYFTFSTAAHPASYPVGRGGSARQRRGSLTLEWGLEPAEGRIEGEVARHAVRRAAALHNVQDRRAEGAGREAEGNLDRRAAAGR